MFHLTQDVGRETSKTITMSNCECHKIKHRNKVT